MQKKQRAQIVFLMLLLYAGIFAQKPITLYIKGDYYSIEYHLGVLSELERLRIPIDTVVGGEWGSFAGALWSAGWSSGQIRELVKSWDSIPKAKEPECAALWQKEWLIKHNDEGTPFLVELNEKKPYFGQIFFDLRVQESLWRSEVGSKAAFRHVDSADNYPFPFEEWRMENGEWRINILSTLVALRDTNGTAEQRYQQKLWSRNSALIVLRPHSKPHPDSLFEAGVQAVQKNRSVLAKIIENGELRMENNSQLSSPPPPRFLYHPVFDSVPAHIQGHLKSFWNPGDTGILAVRNFLEALQDDGSYRNVKLTLDTGSFLQIYSESDPQLSLLLSGFGGTLFGANVAANVDFRFINQFGYNLNLNAFYGQGAKGIEPNLRFERFFMDNGDFFAKVRIYEYEPINFFQKGIYNEARLLNEKGRSIVLGVEKPLGEKRKLNKPVLQIAVEIESREITSGASAVPIYRMEDYENLEEAEPIGFTYESVVTSSLFPFAKWLWQSENYDRWFARDGFMAQLLGGFKAVSVHSYDQEAPLYVSSQGVLSITHPLSRYVSVSAGSEFGANFRRADNGAFGMPDELYGTEGYDPVFGFNSYDPALENRFRFAMGMGSYDEEWQTPNNSSHLYGLLLAGISFQSQGSGIFLTGGYAKDGEPNPRRDMGVHKLFAEPKIRIKTRTFDAVLGQSLKYSIKNTENIAKKRENRIFLSVKSGFL